MTELPTRVSHPRWHLTLNLPAGWGFLTPPPGNPAVVAQSPQERAGFRTTFLLDVADRAGMSEDEWQQLSEQSMSHLENFELHSDEEAPLGASPGRCREVTYTELDHDLAALVWSALTDVRALTATYIVAAPLTSTDQETARAVVASLVFPTPPIQP